MYAMQSSNKIKNIIAITYKSNLKRVYTNVGKKRTAFVKTKAVHIKYLLFLFL